MKQDKKSAPIGNRKLDAVRLEYKVLSDREKLIMQTFKKQAQICINLINDEHTRQARDKAIGSSTVKSERENNIAKQKIEEAVMWFTKGVTSN